MTRAQRLREADALTPRMLQAMRILKRGEATCSNLGAELTMRQTSFGPQTSAREGGRTLRALERRGLVRWRFDDHHWQWSLTDAGLKREGKVAFSGTLSDLCECGHAQGKHYLLSPTWPACSECEKCRVFKKAARLAGDELVTEEECK